MQIHLIGIRDHLITAVSVIKRLSLYEFTLWGRNLVSVVRIRESPYYRGFFKEKIYENFIGITLETVRIREVSVPRGSTVIVLFSKVLVIIHAPAIFSVIVFILIRF